MPKDQEFLTREDWDERPKKRGRPSTGIKEILVGLPEMAIFELDEIARMRGKSRRYIIREFVTDGLQRLSSCLKKSSS